MTQRSVSTDHAIAVRKSSPEDEDERKQRTAADARTTYREIQQYDQKETGLMVSNLYIAQVMRKYGRDMREN